MSNGTEANAKMVDSASSEERLQNDQIGAALRSIKVVADVADRGRLAAQGVAPRPPIGDDAALARMREAQADDELAALAEGQRA